MPALLKARAVPPGGTIGFAAPAGPIDAERLAAGEALFESAGFRTVRRPDLLSHRGYLAGDDGRRAKELSELVSDPEVDAIVCVRGGYGCHRIVARLDPARVREARKPLLGYSDVTTLLLWLRRCAGLVGFHGPMLERGGALPPEDFEAVVHALTGTGAPRPVLRGVPGGGGRAEGRLVGGSLSMLVASLGTPFELDTRRAILLFEEVGEKPYRIDRLLQQLRAAGKLDAVAGIGVGHLVECVDPRYPEPAAAEVIEEILRPLGVPLVLGLPVGHDVPNRIWPVGARARLDGERGELVILERGVAA